MTSTFQNSDNAAASSSCLVDRFNKDVLPAIALDTSDQDWGNTLRGSLPGRLFLSLNAAIASHTGGLSAVGTFMQSAGFWLMVLMFFVIAAPQFANDKGILAIMSIAAFGLRILGSFLGGREPYRSSAVDGIVLLLFGVNVVASLSSHYLSESIHGLSKLVVYLVAYFLFTWSFQYNGKFRISAVLLSLVFGAFLVSVYGLWQYKMGVAPLATWEDPSVEDKTIRVFSTLGNPNLLAGFLIPTIPFAVALTGGAWLLKGWKRYAVLPLLGMSAIILIATFLTGSRGGWLAMIGEVFILTFVACAWLFQKYPRARLPMILGLLLMPIVAAAALHFGAPSYEHRFLSIFSGSEHSSNAYRMNVYRASFAMFRDNWWIGIGTGNKTFEQAYGLYMRSGFDALGAYCVPLEIGVETGVPGLLIFGWLLLTLAARAHRRFWMTADPIVRWFAVGSIAALMGMMAHGLFDTVFYRPQVHFVFWLAVAVLVVLSPGVLEEPEEKSAL